MGIRAVENEFGVCFGRVPGKTGAGPFRILALRASLRKATAALQAPHAAPVAYCL